jgi:hypothetical protein
MDLGNIAATLIGMAGWAVPAAVDANASLEGEGSGSSDDMADGAAAAAPAASEPPAPSLTLSERIKRQPGSNRKAKSKIISIESLPKAANRIVSDIDSLACVVTSSASLLTQLPPIPVLRCR